MKIFRFLLTKRVDQGRWVLVTLCGVFLWVAWGGIAERRGEGRGKGRKTRNYLSNRGRVENENEGLKAGEYHVWRGVSQRLSEELSSTDFNTWIRPLQMRCDGDDVVVLAPNRWVKEEVERSYWSRILELFASNDLNGQARHMELAVGRQELDTGGPLRAGPHMRSENGRGEEEAALAAMGQGLNPDFVFETFVVGNSNELATAGAVRVASACAAKQFHAGTNPLLMYGGVGLGKTHLMHAVGNKILNAAPEMKVLYLSSQNFGNNIVRAIRTHTIQDVTELYRAVDVLMIDDIQFFAEKSRFQEELFHVFNTLLDRGKQVVLTSDRYPTAIKGLESRLKSRFTGGLPVEVDLPELETRAAILQNKGEAEGVEIPVDVAFHIAERIRSNVRELEGALQRVIASATFASAPVTLDLVERALRDLFAIQNRHITVEHIQQVVEEYFNLRHADMLSKSRRRAVARPRQLAMCLAKECTNHSLPEIGDRFGGRDHTTVMHACKKIAELRENSNDMAENYRNLFRLVNQD